MVVFTTEQGMEFYSGNFLDGTITGSGNKVYKQHYSLALETQHFPDLPNQPFFPSTTPEPEQKYESNTVKVFYTK